MSVALSEFRTGLRATIESMAAVTSDQLDQWTREAIGELQAHFPPTKRSAIAVTQAGIREYSLSSNTDLIALQEVEYPGGQTPPRILQKYDRTKQDFLGAQVYDLLELVPYNLLIIGESPAIGELIYITYSYRYPLPEADADLIIVPEEQWPIIHLYVQWKAALHESFDHLVTHPPEVDAADVLRLMAVRAEEQFWRRIEDMKKQKSRSTFTQWRMGPVDRVY